MVLEEGWVDMAIAIGVCGTLIPVFSKSSIDPLLGSIPTLLIVIVGGITGGVFGEMIKKDLEQDGKKSH